MIASDPEDTVTTRRPDGYGDPGAIAVGAAFGGAGETGASAGQVTATWDQPESDDARTARHFQAFARELQDHGARRALAYLLSLTGYRYIAIFRFQGGKATSALFVDRDDPAVEQVGEVPESATYCCHVRDTRGAFTTANAMTDNRLDGHPARAAVPAYCGVPILDPEGTILGTLCHYDEIPQDPAQVDLMLMLQVASALAQGGHVPPYPFPAAV